MNLTLPIAAITDEYSPDLQTAAEAMARTGMTGAELRVLWGKNIMDLTDAELDRAKAILEANHLKVISIGSPLLKCVLPDAPPLDSRFQHDVFASAHTYADQPRLMKRAAEIAHKMGAPVIRIFAFWRTLDPGQCFDRIAEALHDYAGRAAKEDVVLGLENEHACQAGTATEVAAFLTAVAHPNLKAVWDPANAYVSGEDPFPKGYRLLPAGSIAHVHAKDCRVVNGQPHWLPLGTGAVDWKGQIAALLADGYPGSISLETHWAGPGGDKFQASVICGWNLRGLVTG